MGVSPRNFVPEALEGPLGSFQSVGGTHRQNKPPSALLCIFQAVLREGGRAGGAAAGVGDWGGFRNQESFSLEIQRKFRVLLAQVVQLGLLRVWNSPHFPVQRWIQLLSPSTFILHIHQTVQDGSALGLFSSSFSF